MRKFVAVSCTTLGLLGLIGLRRRNDAHPGVAANPAVGGSTTPRA